MTIQPLPQLYVDALPITDVAPTGDVGMLFVDPLPVTGTSVVIGATGPQGATGASTWLPAVDSLTATSLGAVTVPVTYASVKVTNYATPAAIVTITLTTAGAADGQQLVIRFYDSTVASKTLAWVGAEVGAATAPIASKGSITVPSTVEFIFNGVTSLWSCVSEG
jgi:hypothetical protein